MIILYLKYARNMPGICPEYARNMPGYVSLPGLSGTTLRDESGPTIALSRAAERATIKRHGHGKENMCVNRR